MAGGFRKENREAGRGFLEGRELTVIDAGFATYDGEGKWDRESTCFFMEMECPDLERPAIQYWSIGSPTDFQPTKDGRGLVMKKKLSTRCNFSFLLDSLENAGVDAAVIDKMEEDATVLVGLKFIMGVTIRDKKDKNGLPTVAEILEGAAGPVDLEAAAVAAVNRILDGKDSVPLKSIPKLLDGALDDTDPDLVKKIRKVVMGKGFLEEHFTVEGNKLAA